MNISSTRPSAPKVSQMTTPTPSRPLTEKWEVGEATYNSTAELLEQVENVDTVEATYHYTTSEAEPSFTPVERVKNAVGDGIMGATAGAVVGGMAGTVMAVVAGVGEIIGGFMGGRMGGVSSAVVLLPILAGAGIGAAIGGNKGYNRKAPVVAGGTVTGVLSKNESGTQFFPGGQVEKKVDLNAFKAAPLPEMKEATVPPSRPVKNALIGAGLGLATGVGHAIPAVGVFSGIAAGGTVGDMLDQRTSLGAGLGMVAGAAGTAALFYGVTQALPNSGPANYLPIALVAGGLALGGALLGDKLITESETVKAHRDYGSQWWNKNGVRNQEV